MKFNKLIIPALLFAFTFSKSPDLPTLIQERKTNEALQMISTPTFVDGPDKFGITGLMYAASFGIEEIVGALLKKEKNYLNYQDKEGKTALIFAVISRRKATVKLLIDSGANTLLITKEGKSVQDYSKGDSELSPFFSAPENPESKRTFVKTEQGKIEEVAKKIDYALEINSLKQSLYDAQVSSEAAHRKITGVVLNVLVPSLGSFYNGDFLGGVVTLLMVGGTIVSYVVGAPIPISIVASFLTYGLNTLMPIIYIDSKYPTSFVITRF